MNCFPCGTPVPATHESVAIRFLRCPVHGNHEACEIILKERAAARDKAPETKKAELPGSFYDEAGSGLKKGKAKDGGGDGSTG